MCTLLLKIFWAQKFITKANKVLKAECQNQICVTAIENVTSARKTQKNI